MSKSKAPALVRHVAGVLPSNESWLEIKIYSDNSIVLTRPYCVLSPRREWAELKETDASLHKHLIGSLAATAWKDEIYPLINETR